MLAPENRNRWLDILRAVAIVLVVNCHIASTYAAEHGSNGLLAVLGLGGHGVDLFFVLSGWLLGGVLFRERQATHTIDLAKFFRRRWLRTLPAYFAVLGLTLIQSLVQGRFEWAELSFFVFLQTFVFATVPIFGVSWSLCVEEHFYLMVAPLIRWIGESKSRAVSAFVLAMALPQLFRAAEMYGSLQQSHVRIDQCAAGVALAYCYLQLPNFWKAMEKGRAILWVITIGLIAWAMLSRLTEIFAPPLIVYTIISCALVSLAQRNGWWKNSIRVPGAYYIATRSYAIYLIHVEAISVVKRIEIDSLMLQTALTWGIALLLAELLYRCVELPFLKLRDRKRERSMAVDSIEVSFPQSRCTRSASAT